MLTVALPTGRVMNEAIDLLYKSGLPVKALEERGRKLVIEESGYRYILSKPMDVPLYVDYGVADLALAGSDVMLESGASLVELADTGVGKCRIVIAGPSSLEPRFVAHESELMWLKVATKYPRIADSHFASRGIQVEIIHLHGSIELAPKLGLSDCIMDIVQTGKTLKANSLKILENVAPVSLRLIASRKSAEFHWDEIENIVKLIKSAGR